MDWGVFWGMSWGCLDGILGMSSWHLRVSWGVCRVSAGCLGGVFGDASGPGVYGECLGDVWGISGGCQIRLGIFHFPKPFKGKCHFHYLIH